MAIQIPKHGQSVSQSSIALGTSSNESFTSTQQQQSHKLVNRDTANAASVNMTKDVHLKIICKTESSKNNEQHGMGYEYIHLTVNSCQLSV